MTADLKRIEDMDRPEPLPGFPGDPGILALGVDDQDGALRRQQVGDDGADAFPGPCRGERDQMGRAVIAQQPPGVRIAPDQKSGIVLPFHKLDGHSEYDMGEDAGRAAHKPSVNERLKDVLNKPRERLEIEDEREQERGDDENENTRDRDRGEGHSL